jgi:hypothetical protein
VDSGGKDGEIISDFKGRLIFGGDGCGIEILGKVVDRELWADKTICSAGFRSVWTQ